MSSPVLIVVLGKPPRLGEGKSRLARDVGAARAARIARGLLFDTWETVTGFAADAGDVDLALATSAPAECYPLLFPAPRTVPQPDGDLGRRMASLAGDGLGTHDRVLLLGTDGPGVPPDALGKARSLLDTHDVVLGDNPDGGFWCLGVRADANAARDATWLDGLDWDAPDTRAQVEARCAERGLTSALAPSWIDVDVRADLDALLLRVGDDPGLERTRAALALPDDPLSVIVPTLDEGERLDACLDALEALPGTEARGLEVTVADGGSDDGGPERAARRGHVVVRSDAPGRGRQLAVGAALSTGSTLVFLHADTRLPDDALARIDEALASGAEAGAFVTRTVADPSVPDRAGPLLRLADLRSRITRHPYGDQALFVMRDAYDAVGGFRDLPIMEDHDLSVCLAKRRPLARVTSPVTVSGRKIQRNPLRAALLLRAIPLLHRLGVSPERLAKLYRG